MKKLILAGLATVLLFACKSNAEPRYASTSPEIDVVKALIKDYEAGNWEAWMGHYADTAKVYHNTTEASTPAQVAEGLKANLEAAASYKFSDKDMYYEMIIDDQGEKWVNFWANWEGTVAANNKKLVIPVHLTLEFVDGKIVEEHAFYNMAEFVLMMQEIEAAKMEEGDPDE